MAEWQGWLGLIGIAFLIFDRASGSFGWVFGRTFNEKDIRKDVDQLRRDVDKILERASEKNGELQRIIGRVEISLVELKKDNESMRRDMDGMSRRNPR